MKQFLLGWFYRFAALALVWVSGATTRTTWINRHFLETFDRQGQNYLLAIWHNNLIITIYHFGPRGLVSLVSASRDGDVSNFVQKRFGFSPTRGGSSGQAFSVLRTMIRALAGGRSVAITPDGPKGPRYVLKPGVVVMARKTGTPILPMVFGGKGTVQLRTWDRTKLPIPFSRVTIMFGTPIWIGKDETDDEAARLRVERAMRETALQLDLFLGGTLAETEPLLAELLKA